jgi:hypothetical protein
LFFIRQVFTKVAPAVTSVLSGAVISLTNCPRSHGIGVSVGVGGTDVAVGRGVFVGTGVFVGGKDVLVGRMTTGEVEVGNTMGVPSAA